MNFEFNLAVLANISTAYTDTYRPHSIRLEGNVTMIYDPL